MKNKLRKIVVRDNLYLWILKTHYEPIDNVRKEYLAHVKLTVYLNGLKNTPLTISFLLKDDPVIGTPFTNNAGDLNLNKPSIVKFLIEEGLSEGWNPKEKALAISDGFYLLKKIALNLNEI